MNIYLISQDVNKGYDTFDKAIVAANNENEAKLIHPDGVSANWKDENFSDDDNVEWIWAWTKPKNVKIELLGVTTKEIKSGVILASYNAG